MKKIRFFSLETLTENLSGSSSYSPRCDLCGLFKGCQSPKMPVSGQGLKKILIVGEAPGSKEDIQGKPLVGPTGNLLKEKLRKYGVEMRTDCWLTNSLICHPKNDIVPKEQMIQWCRPNLLETVNDLKPEKIILLGARAVQSLIGWLWKENTGAISRWIDYRIPVQSLNCWVCPIWHPSYILRTDYGMSQRENEVRTLLFEKHLERACKLEGRPWKEVPDYNKRIRIYENPDQGAVAAEKLIAQGGPIAFDYETTGLKPDNPDLDIVCCSLSNGKQAIAFPWQGEAIKIVRRFLESDQPKIGWNARFEQRWGISKLGCRVKNFVWDGMLAAHVLDNRPSSKSLKFQAFVQLGMLSYDDEVKPYMKSNNSNSKNRIRELKLSKLLKYCAMDALLEHQIGLLQAKKIGVDL